jgi:hypothetical protein
MVETPSAVTFLSNDSGEMRNSCSMVAAPTKFYVIIWEGFTVKINITRLRPCLPAGQALGKSIEI